ncbi:MAG: glycosyltransferase family 2 protein [Pseudomonadota bacterium]
MIHPRIAVASCMRNEGQFALEWIAYYRVLGFDEIVIFTNDCEDGSDLMMDRLQELGEITHIDNPSLRDLSPQIRAISRALGHWKIRSCDWMLFCDADEFPVIDYGDGKIQDLVAAMPGHTDCIALHWRAFGANGLTDFPPGANVTEVNTLAQIEPDPGGFHKSLFRPNKFSTAIDHMPKKSFGPVALRNAAGTLMNPRAFRRAWSKFRGVNPAHINYEGAVMNHYAIRADDVFVMKNHRGDGRGFSNAKYFLNSGFYNRFNRNDAEDTTIQRHVPAMKAKKAEYLKDPIVAELHQRGIDYFQNLKSEVLTWKQRHAWTKKPKSRHLEDQGEAYGGL